MFKDPQTMRSLPYTIGPLGYSLRRYYVDLFFHTQIPLLPAQTKILDIGGHKNSSRGQFDISLYPVELTYLNITAEKGTDIIADAAHLPFAKDSFDLVICAELLEHIFAPPAVLQEAFRVLKPNGTLLLTIPFLYPIHGDPDDFGRYTPHYWHQLLTEIGFQSIAIENQGSFHTTMVNFYKLYANKLSFPRPFGRIIRFFLLNLWIAPWQFCAMKWEKISPPNKFLQNFTTGFGIVAHKQKKS